MLPASLIIPSGIYGNAGRAPASSGALHVSPSPRGAIEQLAIGSQLNFANSSAITFR